MATRSTPYEYLATKLDDPSNVPPNLHIPKSTRRSGVRLLIWLNVLVNVVLLAWTGWFSLQNMHRIPWKGLKPLYNPVDEVVRYEHKVFPHLTDKTIYHGPPDDATDRAWEDLYVQHKVSLVSGEQAKRLSGETAPDADVKDRYKITVDIAHQLHCLNFLRVMAWPERYSKAAEGRYLQAGTKVVDHVDHCLNSIRETITCHADVSPNVWRRRDRHSSEPSGHHSRRHDHHDTAAHANDDDDDESENHESIAHYNTVHTCRNYAAIQEWAHKHATPRPPLYDDFNSSTPHHHHH